MTRAEMSIQAGRSWSTSPNAYAELPKKKIVKHQAAVWLVNTGWTGGPFGVGKRISIHHTRALLNAADTRRPSIA